MANLEHLAILREGVKIWNDWRADNPNIKPNLKGANLKGANLKGANLKNVNLEEVIAGIQYHWLILILISSSILSLISGLTWAYMSFLLLLAREDGLSPTIISGIVTIILFYVFTISKGLLKGISSLIGFGFIAWIILLINDTYRDIKSGNSIPGALGFILAVFLILFLIACIVFLLAVILSNVIIENKVKNVIFCTAISIFGGVIFFLSVRENTFKSIVFCVVILACLSAYITWRILGNEQIYIKRIAIIITTIVGTSFRGADLTNANFTKAILKNTDFRETIIDKTNWYLAKKLNFARVDKTILDDLDIRNLVTEPEKANINYFIRTLKNKDLTGAELSKANLIGVNLSGAKLSKANLSKANLSEANLSGADLYKTNLSGADLFKARLYRTNFIRANLSNASLVKAQLKGADLIFTDLRGADLSNADLQEIQALSANFEGANFTGACIKNWNINSETNLKNVTCKYVYLEVNQKERRPVNEDFDFAPGDFERLVHKTIKTVDLIFKDGIDWKSFFKSFQELQNIQETKGNGNQISIRAIETRDDGSLVIRINTPNLSDIDKKEIEHFFYVEYKKILTSKEKEYKNQLKAKDDKIDFYMKEYYQKSQDYRQKSAELSEITKILASRDMTYFDQRHQNVNYQYNAGGNINISNVKNEVDLRQQLEALQSELNEAIKAELFSEEQATDADYKLKKAVLESKKIQPDKNQLITYLKETKDIIIGVGAAGGIVQAIIKVIEIVKNIF